MEFVHFLHMHRKSGTFYHYIFDKLTLSRILNHGLKTHYFKLKYQHTSQFVYSCAFTTYFVILFLSHQSYLYHVLFYNIVKALLNNSGKCAIQKSIY